jgi:replication factor C small subunit
VNPKEVKSFIMVSLKGDFMGARNLLYTLLNQYGLSVEDLIKQIHRTIFDLTIPDDVKINLIEMTSEIEFRLTEGSNEYIQLETLLAQFALTGKKI